MLSRETKLIITEATDGEVFRRGQVYVGPPNTHVLVERGRIRLEQSPKESWHRPSIDVLFRSAALAYGRRVVGVVLSGLLYDGTAGLWQVKKHGGVTIVQDPDEAREPSMPQSALENVAIDYCLRARDIGLKLMELAAQGPASPPITGSQMAKVLIVEDERIVAINLEKRLGKLGYKVSGVVSSGEAAIELAGRILPDVILMDIHLAGSISGTEAARQIWEKLQTPVVYLTAFDDDKTLDEVKTTEPYGYVVKPFHPHEVHAAIQLALDRRDKELRAGNPRTHAPAR